MISAFAFPTQQTEILRGCPDICNIIVLEIAPSVGKTTLRNPQKEKRRALTNSRNLKQNEFYGLLGNPRVNESFTYNFTPRRLK